MAEVRSDDIFQLVRTLARSAPYTRAKIEAMFDVKLKITDQNSYFVFLSGAGPGLRDGTQIESIDLRLAKTNAPHQGFIALGITGRCVTLPEVESQFGKLKLTDVPRGRTADESIGYTGSALGATISVGFKEGDPNCLSAISIEPKA